MVGSDPVWEKYLPTIAVLRILIFIPVIICISNLLVIQTIIPLKRERILPALYGASSLLYFASLRIFGTKICICRNGIKCS